MLFFCFSQKIRQNKPCGGTIYCVIILLSAEYIVGFGGRFCRKRFKMQILEKIRRFFLLYIVSAKKLFAISRRFFCRKKPQKNSGGKKLRKTHKKINIDYIEETRFFRRLMRSVFSVFC